MSSLLHPIEKNKIKNQEKNPEGGLIESVDLVSQIRSQFKLTAQTHGEYHSVHYV